jgi:hypothetical protein
MKLLSLEPEGIRLVTPELAAGTLVRWPEPAWRPVVADLPADQPSVALARLDRVLDELIATLPAYDTAIDAWLAPRLHMALPLSRRAASNPGVFRFLSVVHRPDVIRHRWANVSWATMRSRFWSIGTRHTSNMLARLWWIAELTRDGSSYALTERVLTKQSLAIQIFVRSWSQHRPAVEAFVDTLHDAPSEDIEHAARMLSRYLATTPLEGLGREDIVAALLNRGPGGRS